MKRLEHFSPTYNHAKRLTLKVSLRRGDFAARYLILDEADRMLSMDFEEALDKITQVTARNLSILSDVLLPSFSFFSFPLTFFLSPSFFPTLQAQAEGQV